MKKKNIPQSDMPPIWAQRIQALLEEQNMKQTELSKISKISASSISDWIGGNGKREPKVLGLKAIADALGVSMDYLMGAEECTSADNEKIHKRTGLSDKAIKNLVRLRRKVKTGEISAAKKLAVCNFLLETINRTGLFEFLYNYLLGEYYFNDGQQNLGATEIYLKTPNGAVAERLNFAENYAHVYLSLVLQELSLLKKVTDKIRLKKQKADYSEWLKTPEGIAFEREIWEQQAAYEDDKEDEE